MLMLTFLSYFLPIQLASSSGIFKQVVDTYMNTYRRSYLSVISKGSQAQSG